MAKDPSGSDENVIRGILRYGVEYPDAKDTPDGILNWWRPKDQPEWRKEDVQKALDFLTSKGWLTVRNTSPSHKIFGFNNKFMEEIRKFLIEIQTER